MSRDSPDSPGTASVTLAYQLHVHMYIHMYIHVHVHWSEHGITGHVQNVYTCMEDPVQTYIHVHLYMYTTIGGIICVQERDNTLCAVHVYTVTSSGATPSAVTPLMLRR